MITAHEIREKTVRLYPTCVQAWLEGNLESHFPVRIRCDLKPPRDNFSLASQEVNALRSSSKSALGFGYRLEEKQRADRSLGSNAFPVGVYIDSLEDAVRLVRKNVEFEQLAHCVEMIRARLPALEEWLRSSWKKLLPRLDSIEGLISVAEYLMKNPRPNCHTRELPLPISTKLVEHHESFLAEWLDRLLPNGAIEYGVDASQFERRYGFRYSDSQIPIRVPDNVFADMLKLPCSSLTLPIEALQQLAIADATVIITENKASILRVPALPKTVVMGGIGNAIVKLAQVDWLHKCRILYWGDCDAEGFLILSRLREIFPHVVSILMDRSTFDQFEELSISGNASHATLLNNLNDAERAALDEVVTRNKRLEQEKLPASVVHKAIHDAVANYESSGLQTQ